MEGQNSYRILEQQQSQNFLAASDDRRQNTLLTVSLGWSLQGGDGGSGMATPVLTMPSEAEEMWLEEAQARTNSGSEDHRAMQRKRMAGNGQAIRRDHDDMPARKVR